MEAASLASQPAKKKQACSLLLYKYKLVFSAAAAAATARNMKQWNIFEIFMQRVVVKVQLHATAVTAADEKARCCCKSLFSHGGQEVAPGAARSVVVFQPGDAMAGASILF